MTSVVIAGFWMAADTTSIRSYGYPCSTSRNLKVHIVIDDVTVVTTALFAIRATSTTLTRQIL